MKITRSKSESFYHSWDYSPTIKSFIKSNEKIENNNQVIFLLFIFIKYFFRTKK